MSHRHATIEDTVYFGFVANDTSGSAVDGSTPLFDVRLGGDTAGAIPVLSGTPTLLTHANYGPGAYEVAVAATAANGFAAGNTYSVFVTVTADGQTPGSCLGTVTLAAIPADVTSISGDATAADNLELDYDGTGYAKANSTIGTATTLTNTVTLADGAHGGSSAALTLDHIVVSSSTDHAIELVASAAGKHGLYTRGTAGDASGIYSQGGLHGVQCVGLNVVNGAGFYSIGAIHGLQSVGQNAGSGIRITTTGTGPGLDVNSNNGIGFAVTSGGSADGISITTSTGDEIDSATVALLQSGLSTVAATDIVSAGAITTSGGAVTTVTTLTGHTAQTGDSFVRIGSAGAGLTSINLPNQTMDITGSITGNLSGSVGSVTGAVGSVTGNVDGNVAGSVASVTAEVTADVTKLSGSATAADNLEASALGIVSSSVNDASATTTSFVSALTEATDDHYNGRIVVFTSGAVAGQATDITDYTGATKTIAVTALTEAPANSVTFVIV